ncbi:polysaccharide biosynthesis/export family protein [Blastopirellula marina]|uniref:Polysaccharide export protein N-terminal domain-containing protein n=1 Tax=Blastopirellula marina TaxID=124 RepID=A0A2S8GHD7_9BACT|nr:polysaccharide biosynthesis/export family protein [Blastopirellula marina]PQO28972.1 hypothetical protein C5Y98_22430 [Blastopirellula marina]PQO43879.1 hypothetical protein C5Y93_22095 [Blastopirellula marina]PTL42244.1 hypothetical protein C5Y97_22440 [Blastopirellula marina]
MFQFYIPRTGGRVNSKSSTISTVTLAMAVLLAVGCATTHHNATIAQNGLTPPDAAYPHGTMPRELQKVSLPEYTIEPPDILNIQAVSLIPKAPYRYRVYDSVFITVENGLPDAPIAGEYPIGMQGTIDLGLPYGTIRIAGLNEDEAEQAVLEHLKTILRTPQVNLITASIAALQQISGEHLVGPDGTVNLGTYGSVRVVGLTMQEAKIEIENYLARYLEQPEIAVSMLAYNSKVYYIVTEGAGLGDGVFRFPVTGNDTVLDAISNVNGLEQVSSKRIWVARPTPFVDEVQILPVDWKGITAQASTTTNYQLMPGDRVFIAEDKVIAFDNALAKTLAPLERIMGFSLLGVNTATRFSGSVLKGGGNPRGSNNF